MHLHLLANVVARMCVLRGAAAHLGYYLCIIAFALAAASRAWVAFYHLNACPTTSA